MSNEKSSIQRDRLKVEGFLHLYTQSESVPKAQPERAARWVHESDEVAGLQDNHAFLA